MTTVRVEDDMAAQEAFERYALRTLPAGCRVPEALREGAAPPPTWPYPVEAWEALTQAAREHLRLKPCQDFACAIALRGYYPDELATGELRPGAQINAVTGAVVRPPEPSISAAQEERARHALNALGERNLSIDSVLQYSLELAAYGRYHGHPRRALAAIEAAEEAVSRFDTERRAGALEEQRKPVLTVRSPFRAKARSYAAGTYRVEPEVAADLRDWREKMEAEARRRDWDAPMGYDAGRWPPFSLEDQS